MMKLGTQTGFSRGLGLTRPEVYKIMHDAGFESVDYSLMNGHTSPLWKLSDDELKAQMLQIKQDIHSGGIFVGQTHSPMDALWISDPDSKEARLKAQIQAIKAASFLESPYIVIHALSLPSCVGDNDYELCKEMNMEFYNFLKPYLEEYNVKAAIENNFKMDPYLQRYGSSSCSSAAQLKDYVDTLNSDRFVVCLDVGHCVFGAQDPVKMIHELGKEYLHVTHMQDNNYLRDEHLMPGMGKIDWYSVGKALNDIGFDKVFNYEADNPYGKLVPFGTSLSLKLFKLYAEFGKAVINVR